MNSNRGTVFSMLSAKHQLSSNRLCYLFGPCRDVINRKIKAIAVQGSEESICELEDCWSSAIVTCCCEKLVAEARGQFGNPEEGERPPLEAVTRR
jgi:hypothetical protein